MAPPRPARQPLQEPGRNCAGTSVPVQSVGEPHRQVLTNPPGTGRLPVLSSGARVRLWKSILRSLKPRNDALMTPSSLVEIESTYWDASVVISHPQLPAPGGSPPELYSSATAFLQGVNARIASDILARTALALTFGKTMAARTPITMITIMSSTIVNPAWLFVLRMWPTVFPCWSRRVSRRRLTRLAASSVPDEPSPNKPLISIMKQLEFRGKGIPDAATRRPDFDSN